MHNTKFAALQVAAVSVLTAMGSVNAWAADADAPLRPVQGGLAAMFKPPPFTAAQVEQGRALFEANCAACHGPDLNGGESSRPLKGRPFRAHWAMGNTIGALFKYVRENMPPGRAGSLSAEDYAAVIALLMNENGLKPGTTPLPADYEALRAFRLPYQGDTSGGLALHSQLPPWPAKPNPADKLTPVTDEMLRNPSPSDWLTWRRTLDGHGFSPLSEITKANVPGLRLVWTYNLTAGPNTSTPLVHDGVIFVHSIGDTINALDAATGELLWNFHRDLPMTALAGPGGGTKRNIALYADKLYVGTANGNVVALDAKTGKLDWEGSTGGSMSGGPLVVGGKVIQGLGRGAPRLEGPPAGNGGAACVTCGGAGHIVALDAADGHPLWKFNVIPEQGELGSNTWNDLPFERRSGGAVWTTSYYDPDLNLVFTGTGNTYDNAALVKRISKPGITNDGLFTNTTLAINPDTGKLAWYFQHFSRELWDLDWAFEQLIASLPIAGQETKAVVTLGKPAIVDIVEAATGRYLFSLDPGLQNIVLHIDPKTGAKIADPKLTPGGTVKTVCPHVGGAKNWTPSSYNDQTGVLYAPLTESCMTMEPVEPGEISPFSSPVRYSVMPRPGSDGKYGRVQAFDLKQRKLLWAARERAPLTSGILATAGGLLFAGKLDRTFTAYDEATGEALWQTRLASTPSGAPITFSVNDKQYLAVITGFGSMLSTSFLPLVPEIPPPTTANSAIYVFALP